jgi:protein-S-isoprenylcysteine O-methyltransferase Ste14
MMGVVVATHRNEECRAGSVSGRRRSVVKEREGRWTFLLAGSTLVVCWSLFVLFFHRPVSQVLFILGNITVGVGVLLIVLAIGSLRKRGQLAAAQDFTATTQVVKRGIYSVVRHPLYLGWLLTYPAAMLVSQHWLIILVGVVGMGSMVQIVRRADRQLIAKFGAEYETYMEQVPQLNILLGIVRKLKRKV